MIYRLFSWFILGACLMCVGCNLPDRTEQASGESVLYTFDLAQVAAENAQYATYADESPLNAPGLRLRAEVGSPSFRLPEAGSAPWAEAKYLVADIWHNDRHSDILTVHFYGESPDTARISGKMGILPGLKTRLVLPLEYLDGQTFFTARRPRQLKGTMPGRRLPPELISAVTLSLDPVADDFHPELWITGLRLTRDLPPPLPDEKPVVDSLGQWTARNWPGKTTSESELVSRLNTLYEQAQSAAFPDDWSRYGGWKKKQFNATGFFRTEHDGSRWWLVDPEGYAFYSVGVDVMNPGSEGPYEGMEDLFSWMPPRDGVYEASYGKRAEQGSVSFLTANLIRAFGSEWESRWQIMTSGLMKQWRFNTIGNWSNPDFIQATDMPFVLPLSGFPETELSLYRDFPDVFSPEYDSASVVFAAQMEAYRDNPFLIGYFLRNEPLWAFGDNIIASEMLATNTPSYTRRALVAWLRERYQSDAAAFSQAWARPFDAFEALETEAILDAAYLSARAETDLRAFSKVMVNEYLKRPSEALRRVAPNHMNLGIRYAWISSELCYEGAAYVDVFSINAYEEKPDAGVIEEITRRTGKPVMIGEFHHGAIDRGLPSTGIRGVASQEDRGIAYRYYVEQGAALPGLVGLHFFQLNDQPVLGRFDGENYNIGLVDICNVPYKELTEAATATNGSIYSVASGEQQPVQRRAEKIPDIYF